MLATLFWPEHDQAGARANLRRDLSRLKNALGDDALLVDRAQVGLNPDVAWWLDVAAFQACADQLRQHQHFPQAACAECQAACEQAIALYTADFMAGFSLPDSPEFDEWQFFQAEGLRRSLAEGLQRLVEWYTGQGEYERAIEYGRRWLALDSLHEPAHRALIRLFAWADQHAAALRQYEECVRLLQDELGIAPEPETTDLYEAVRTRRLEPPAGRRPSPPPAPAAPLIEPPRFEIGELLAIGGHGELYRGRDRLTDAPVVIKRLKPELVSHDLHFLTRFQREAEILRQLNHPNIVHMLDMFEAAGQHHIVMEYVPGGSLRHLLDTQPRLPLDQALAISLELADALSRAHHLGIIHRDIKPANILLAEDGTPRLTDFGIARLEKADVSLTQSGSLLGTPAYLSPEAIHGDNVDHRSDIWSFGAVLYEMLAGAPPFGHESLVSILVKILNDPLPDIHQARPDVPAPLIDLLGRMLSRDREQRPGSMRQVAATLEAIRDGRFITPLPVPAAPTATADGESSWPVPGAARPPHNLPQPPTPFIGREEELKKIEALLVDDPECRLLTLVGPGGIGKTRLALEAGRRALAAFADGVYLIPLAGATAVDFIISAVAASLDFQFSGAATPKTQLLHHLRDKKMLLILDNFEHLLDGADLVADMLHIAAPLHVLVTSRERLHLQEEWGLDVLGLSYPASAAEVAHQPSLEAYSAARLFIQRARRADAGFTLAPEDVPAVVELCRLLAGMPLGLELAAPWVRVLSCAEIVTELKHNLDLLSTSARDVPERHRSLQAIFAQTWQTLSPEEQAILRQLAIFQGGSRREAAQQVAGATLSSLATLIDKALLGRTRDGRYQLHELIRQFAAGQLQDHPEEAAAVAARHSGYYLGFLARRTADIKGGRQQTALAEIAAEIDNVRLAWSFAVDHADTAALSAAAECFWLFSEFRGVLYEGEAAFRQALEALTAVRAQTPDLHTLPGFLQAGQGCLAARRGWFEEGLALMTQGIDRLRRADPIDRQKEAFALAWLAFVLVQKGRFAAAAGYAQQSLDACPETGDAWIRAGSLRLLGAAALFSGRLDEAESRLNECLAACNEIGERRIRIYATTNLGLIAQARGDYATARQLLEQALELSRQLGDRLSRAELLRDLSRLVLQLGQLDEVVVKIEECRAIYREIGRGDSGAVLWILAAALRRQGEVDRAYNLLLDGFAAAKAMGHQPDLAACLTEMGRLVRLQGRLPLSRQVLQEALAIWQEVGNEPETAVVWLELGHTAAAGSQPQTAVALEAYDQAVVLANRHRLAPIALDGMVGWASLLGPEHTTQAVELLALAERHPASSYWTQTQATVVLQTMPEALVTAVRHRTSLPDWQEMVEQLLHAFDSAELGAVPPALLPSGLTPFVGREQELAELEHFLLHDPECRLLTLTGPGGIGKTRLAIAAATAVAAHFPHGVYHVPLAPLDAPEHIIIALAESLGFHSFTGAEPKQLALDFLRGRQALLVMDNFEHLLPGVPLLGEILAAAPASKIIATSREHLNLSGEVIYNLSGLDCPNGAGRDPTTYSAVQLLLAHTHQVRPDYQLQPQDWPHISRICRLVQGMPLALVLATGWLNMLTFAEIAEEISRGLDFLETERRDIPARQRSVRAAFDGSWARLSREAQEIFARLSVFRGGFTRQAAREVADAGLRALRTLVNSSFVVVDADGRYGIHELLRQYGLEHLRAMDELEKTRDAHSAYYLNALHSREAEVKGRRQAPAMAEVEADLENVRAAWKWGLARRDTQGIGSALECLHVFCDLRGRYHEGMEFFSQAVAAFAPATPEERPSLLYGRLLLRFVFLRVFTPDLWPEARLELLTAVAIIEQHDAPEEQLVAYLAVGTYRMYAEKNPAEALPFFEKCLALATALDETYYRVGVLIGLGSCYGMMARPDELQRYTLAASELAGASGNQISCAMSQANLAEYLLGMGDYAAAEARWRNAAALAQSADSPTVVSYSQALLAFIAFLRGEGEGPDTAVRASLSTAEKISYAVTSAYAAAVLSLWQSVQGDYSAAQAWAEASLANPTNNTVGLVLAHWGLSLAFCGQGRLAESRLALGGALRQVDALQLAAAPLWLLPLTAVLLAEEGEYTWAAELLGLAEHHPLSEMGWAARWPILAATRARLAQALGDGALAAAQARGRELAVETAVARLLDHFPQKERIG